MSTPYERLQRIGPVYFLNIYQRLQKVEEALGPIYPCQRDCYIEEFAVIAGVIPEELELYFDFCELIRDQAAIRGYREPDQAGEFIDAVMKNLGWLP